MANRFQLPSRSGYMCQAMGMNLLRFARLPLLAVLLLAVLLISSKFGNFAAGAASDAIAVNTIASVGRFLSPSVPEVAPSAVLDIRGGVADAVPLVVVPVSIPPEAPAASITTPIDQEANATPSNSTVPNATAPNATVPNTTAPNATAPSTTMPNPTLPPQWLPHVPWIEGTWTTGYWDCCKPSCAWPRKGRVTQPMRACDASTGELVGNSNSRSVCDGGRAASCHSHQPFLVRPGLAFGFAAAAVSGSHGLTGDDNCAQCYELRFVNRMHGGTVWGGAHAGLVNKTMIVQVTNIGYDVTGAHSFDIQIPGAGQGIFSGCATQYPGFATGDFDCDNRYGGCTSKDGCSRLPLVLQPGCRWRYDWYHWLREGGQTNNPWVKFRRVRCPQDLTAISGFAPLDDHLFRAINPREYF
eukprot:CAMPEP_0179109050 /NCGR_PEP_ID=MMETSP0796-20121207/50829_1 /TAXON_ID=73915 /ORGANISM="Pyrodinium bahamense, Strain pbaha01" /LENGTH=412 /DNA_ID=CAMNT_0020807147 /DNA_START=56 /DNA_END=1294 /DNA_ORIENTATION=-